jgi:hypothetical protein
MLHAQNSAPLPHRCRTAAIPLPHRCRTAAAPLPHRYLIAAALMPSRYFFREIDRIFRVFAYYLYKNNN